MTNPSPDLAKAQELARRILHLAAQENWLIEHDTTPEDEPEWLEDTNPDHLQDARLTLIDELLRLLAPQEFSHWNRIVYGEDTTE